ncbi:reverse transcriptase domain-containing protein [Tanacetum coccineum]
MLNSSTGIFSFQFSSMEGLDAMLENGLWFIRKTPLILKKWNPDVNLLKEDVGNVLVWVELHGVPMTAFTKDGLSAIATNIGTPLMLDSYTSDMCTQSWGRSSSVRALIEVRADVELKDNIVVAMPKLIGARFYTCNVSKKKNVSTSGNKKKDVVPIEENAKSSSTSTTPIVEKIDKIKRLIIDGTATLVDDDGILLKNVDSSGDHDSDDEVASIDKDMANCLASKDVSYGQDIPYKIQDICDNLDIKETNTELYMEFPTMETSVGKKSNVPIKVSHKPVAESTGSDATMSVDVSSEAPNINGQSINVVPLSYANNLSPKSLTKANLQKLEANVPNGADYDVWLPLASVHEVHGRMKNFLHMYFIGKRLAFLVVECLMATKIGTPMMLDSYINSMYLESWCRSYYTRIQTEINACNDFSDYLVMVVSNLEGNGYTKETIRIEYVWEPPRCSACLIFGHSSADYTKAPKVAPI